jgi:ParB-like chromosome segregation protein Spo0J
MAKSAKGTSGKPSDMPEKIEKWPLEDLVPYARNARRHSDLQVDQLAKSITEFGWTIPVLVDEGGEIIAGHGRVLAAQKLGLPDAPVIVARGWTDERKRAYRIADNKLAENSEWDRELLALDLAALEDAGESLGSLGFAADELQALLSASPQRGGFLDDVAAEDVEETIRAQTNGAVVLRFHLDPAQRDEVVYWLNAARDRLKLNTAAEALVALAREGQK